ncbi:Intradiol ring-cleavage dioxygenase [Zopfochytrium polystomum]|nr:Intradiol ring-cleavage dioxygenase [Zopfochytrium polystomum]
MAVPLAVLLVALLGLASRQAHLHTRATTTTTTSMPTTPATKPSPSSAVSKPSPDARPPPPATPPSRPATKPPTLASRAVPSLSAPTPPPSPRPWPVAPRASSTPKPLAGPTTSTALIQRSNMTENQLGVALVLDVSVVDIASCSPLVDAAVEFWSCNATGYYSGFTGISPSTNQQVGSCVNGGTSSGSGPGASGCLTDELTFLRGFVLTDDNGVAEMTTIFPGFYNGRTPHIHVTVHTGGSVGSDGTYVGGEFRHIGQLFPGDEAATSVYSIASLPYYSLGTDFIKLADDQVASKEGYSGYGILSLTNMGSTIAQGMIGAVTIYVDSTATQKDPSTYTYSDADWIGTSVATKASYTTAKAASSTSTTTATAVLLSAARVASDFVWLHLAAIVLAIALAF